MKKRPGARARIESIFGIAATALAAAALAAACLANLLANPIPGYGRSNVPGAERQRAALGQIDRLATSATPNGGNAFLEFRGFDPASPVDEQFMSMVYYRGSFAAYPARLFVARPSDVVNNGRDIAKAAFSPGEDWLRAHGARFILTLSRDRAGTHTGLRPVGAAPEGAPASPATAPAGGAPARGSGR